MELVHKSHSIHITHIDRSVYVLDRSDLSNNEFILVVVHGEIMYHPRIREIVSMYLMERRGENYVVRDIYEKIVFHNYSSKCIIAEKNFPELIQVFNLHSVTNTPMISPIGKAEIPSNADDIFITREYSLFEITNGTVLIYEIENRDTYRNTNITSFEFYMTSSFIISVPIPLLRRGIVVCDSSGDWYTKKLTPMVNQPRSVIADIEAVVLYTRVYFRQNPDIKRIYYSFQPHEIYSMCVYNNGKVEKIRLSIGDVMNMVRNIVDEMGVHHYKNPE